LATHRQRILEGVRGDLGKVVNTGVPPTHWAYDPTLSEHYGHAPDEARALLSEAGWEDRDGDGIREDPEGTPLSIELLYNLNQERQEVAEIMQAQLREVGVDITPRGIDFESLVSIITSPERSFEGFLLSWEAEFRLDERNQFHSEAVDGPFAFAGVQDSILDRYLDTLQLVTDREQAKPLWREYQLRQMEVHPNTFLYAPDRQNGVRSRLIGVEMDVRGDWQNVREWWIPRDLRKTP
jgi:peptide/nickel transport system substrate-binding protein